MKSNFVKIFIDPTSEHYYQNILFDEKNEYYNRDNCLAPYIYLREFLNKKGYEVHTADFLLNSEKTSKTNIYISLGVLNNYKKLSKRKDVILSAFFILEPPVVAPNLYKQIPALSKYFKKIFVHTTGDDLKEYTEGIKNIYKFYWPQTYGAVIDEYWNNKNRKFLTLINANKKPSHPKNELYSERIKAIKYFSQYNEIDLYGFGWDRYCFSGFLSRLNKFTFLTKLLAQNYPSYKGSVKSKYETLSKYNFAICFENMILSGYITEKIFDCFFVGTIPIYLGAPDIEKYVPKECFIDMRDFSNYDELRKYLHSLTEKDIDKYRENAKDYLNSEKYKPFTKEYFAELILQDCVDSLYSMGEKMT